MILRAFIQILFLLLACNTVHTFPTMTVSRRTSFLSNKELRLSELSVSARSHRGYDEGFDDFEEEQENFEPISPPVAREHTDAEHEYSLAVGAGPIHPKCPLDESQIHRVIAGRAVFQRKQDYEKADQLLKGLNRNGVFVHDKRREWRADGLRSFGTKPAGYIRRGGNWEDRTPEDIANISVLLERRFRAKKERDFQKADLIEAKLNTQLHVEVDDKRREWSFVATDVNLASLYVPSPLAPLTDSTHTMDQSIREEIQQLLLDRSEARKAKKYKDADTIRDRLLEQFSVAIDDRTREWKVVTDWENSTDPFVADAQESQRSAFARRLQQGNRYDSIRSDKQVL